MSRWMVVVWLLFAAQAQARDALTVAGHRVEAGTKASFFAQAGSAELPLSVLHGAEPGPVLTVTAGIHGDEFPALYALQRLRAEIDPGALHGSLIIVHLANPAGFHARLIALHPHDGKNLNRVFPGRADGTHTEQIAHFLTTEIIARSDYLIDLHSGSANQRLWPHVYSPVVGDAALDARTLAFARATGLRDIVLYGERPRDPANSVSYPNTAQTRGKPGLTIEIGQRGERDEASIARLVEACRNALRHLRMIPGRAAPAADATLYRQLHAVASPATGLFEPAIEVGARVARGALLGQVIDYFGAPLAELRAPRAGVVLMVNDTPPIAAGEAPVTIGEPQPAP